ncbi:MAG: hypothetical protein MUF83_09985 [Acidimicrobiales bacterium]|jgi:hypothetical protein|nr:hypothetical protein [Acidimicrobiales bacterium]
MDEIVLGDFVLRLDGTVVEVLHRTGLFHRFHVNHVAVEAKPRGDGLRLTIGIEQAGMIMNGDRIDVPGPLVPAVTALFERAKALRTV